MEGTQTINPTALAQALIALASTTKAVSSTPRSSGYAHGLGGLLSAPGMSREIFNAMLLPHAGLAARLPSYPSNETHPLYGILTGVTAGSGSDPTGVCDDPPTAGLAKLCSMSYPFGRSSLMTPVFDIDRVGQTTNRGEYYDFQLVGDPFAAGDGKGAPTPPAGLGMQGWLNNEVGKSMFELAVEWVRKYGPDVYTGNPTNNTSGGGRKYYHGLQRLVNTGYRDAETQVACPAADSIIHNFASANVTTANTNIVRLITSILRRLKINARGMGLMPVKWIIVMRETLFYELTEVWPCSFSTYRCANVFSTSQVLEVSADRMQEMRRDMRGNMDSRTGQYLWIDDEKVEVVFDDLLTETALANGAFNSDIYFLPETVIGGRRVLYMEYLNYDAPNGALAAARALAPDGSFFTTDGGRYLWHKKPPTNFCVQALVKAETRLILRTPQIAARLQNVAYTPLVHERDWSPTGYYFANGGKTDRLGYGPSFYSPTA